MTAAWTVAARIEAAPARALNAKGRSSLPLDKGGSNRQLRLLQREGVLVVDGRVSLAQYQWDPFGS